MLSFILLVTFILSCETTTTPTSLNHIQDSKNGNFNSDDIGGTRGKFIHEFSTKYKHITQLTILWCYHHGTNVREHEFIFDIMNHKNQHKIQWKTINANASTATVDVVTMMRSLYRAGGISIKLVPIEALLHQQNSLHGEISIRNYNASQNNKFENILKSECLHQIVVLDMSCGNDSLKILKMASDTEIFNSSYHWLLMEDYDGNRPKDEPKEHETVEDDKITLIKFLDKLNINMNTELILARKIDRDHEDYLLYDVWNPGREFGGELNVTEVGRFTQRYGLQMYDWFKKTTTIVRRMDMKNVPIRCMIVVTNKFYGLIEDYLRNESDYHLDSMHRFNFALLNHVRDMFNFSFRLYRTNSWGYERNGSYDGMIGALIKREVEIGGSPIFFLIERARLIDYTAHTWVARPCFIFRHPDQMNLSPLVFLQPFSNGVWIAVLLSGIIVIILLWETLQIEESIKMLLNGKISSNIKSISEKPSIKKLKSLNSGLAKQKHKQKSKNQIINYGPSTDIIVSKKERRDEEKFRAQNNRHEVDVERQHYESCLEKTRTLKNNFEAKIIRTSSYHKSKLLILNHSDSNILNGISKQIYWNGFPHHSSKKWYSQQCRKILTSRKINERSTMISHFHTRFSEEGGNKKMYTGVSQKIMGSGFLRRLLKRLSDLFNRNHENMDKNVKVTSVHSISECVLFVIGALCQQGPSYRLFLYSGRFIIISTLLFTFCINQFYSASIVSTLIMRKPKTIKTLRNLIDSPLRVIIEDLPYNQDYFRRTTDPDAIELYKKKMNFYRNHSNNEIYVKKDAVSVNNNYNNCNDGCEIQGDSLKKLKSIWNKPEQGIKLMRGGEYAFHVDVATAYKIIKDTFTEQEICELSEIQLFPPRKMVNIVRKGSSLRKMITYGLRRIKESGLMDRQRKLWHSPKPECVRKIKSSDLKVGLQTCTSAFFILIFGVTASVAILFLETIYDLWRHPDT